VSDLSTETIESIRTQNNWRIGLGQESGNITTSELAVLLDLIDAQDAIISTLPTCWTLVDGVPEQTRPITLDMEAWSFSPDYPGMFLAIGKVTGIDSAGRCTVAVDGGARYLQASDLYDSPEAAKARAEQ
jgi:hypothetical protein